MPNNYATVRQILTILPVNVPHRPTPPGERTRDLCRGGSRLGPGWCESEEPAALRVDGDALRVADRGPGSGAHADRLVTQVVPARGHERGGDRRLAGVRRRGSNTTSPPGERTAPACSAAQLCVQTAYSLTTVVNCARHAVRSAKHHSWSVCNTTWASSRRTSKNIVGSIPSRPVPRCSSIASNSFSSSLRNAMW